MEEMSGGHVMLIGQDNARDCSITSGDVPRGPEMDIGCHRYDTLSHCQDTRPLEV